MSKMSECGKMLRTSKGARKQYVKLDLKYSERKYGKIAGWEDRWSNDVQSTYEDYKAVLGVKNVIVVALFDHTHAVELFGYRLFDLGKRESSASKWERGMLRGLVGNSARIERH